MYGTGVRTEMKEIDTISARDENALYNKHCRASSKVEPGFCKSQVGGSSPSSGSGYKQDKGKLRYDLVPVEAVEALTWVLTWACERERDPYPERNWEEGMSWLRVFAGVMRHLWAWRKRKVDPESGRSHLWHALCGIAFLITYEVRNVGKDDR